jgi:hypothetical protein
MNFRSLAAGIAGAASLLASLLVSPAATAQEDTLISYGPHAGVEYFDAKSVLPWDISSPDKALVAHGITFNITYEDVATGFNDPASGAQRRARLEDALTYCASVINETGTLDVVVQASQFDGSGFLAVGSTFFSGAAILQNGSAFSRLSTGVKPFEGTPEIRIQVDFGHTYNIGTGNPTPQQVDLLSVLIHEVTHALGFISTITSNGTSQIGIFTVLDGLAQRTLTGVQLVSGNPPAFAANVSDLTSNNISFDGAEATAAFGSVPPLYAPPNFATGSSISHFDNNIPGGAIMEPFFGGGEVKRQYAPVEVGALIDLGYSNASDDPTPVISVAPGVNANFGNVVLGANQALNFTVTNTGSGTLTGTASTTGTSFSVVSGANYSIPAGADAVVSIRFTPQALGNLNGSATFTGGTNGPIVVQLLGVGLAVPAPILTVTPANFAFGNVAQGSNATTNFTVTNTGTGTLTGTASATGTGFSVVSGANYSLGAGASQQVGVRFAPQAVGAANGTINFTGGTNGPLARQVTGTGTAAPAAVIAVNPSVATDFGETPEGGTTDRTFTVSNTGGSTLTGTATANGIGFSIVSGGNYSIAPAASAQVVVRFTAPAQGAFSGTAVFTGGANGPINVTLTATGAKGGGTGCSCGPGGAPKDYTGDVLVLGLTCAVLAFSARPRRMTALLARIGTASH